MKLNYIRVIAASVSFERRLAEDLSRKYVQF
jgi:hypothetical protein